MTEGELLSFCREFFTLGVNGLYYSKWRKGLPLSCVGERAGNTNGDGYRNIKIKGRLYKEHRLVWLLANGNLPEGELDHRDGNKENCNIDNLRLSERGQNCSNRNGWSKSGYKGVYPEKRGKPWVAQITVDKQVIRLGTFDTKEEAAIEYDLAAIHYKGEYAKTNFPKENYFEKV